MEYNVYRDMEKRTNGEVYIGVVGPVRSGKSTFIKRFMEECVVPYIDDFNQKERTIDEMPQSASGKTVMTTEPKFIPQEAAEISIDDETKLKVRLIDCVGYMVDGASGHMDGENDRMVKTPWIEEEVPFSDAASIGTKKVIREHATIGVVITTDGSIGDIPGENYKEPTAKAIEELKSVSKPFVLVLNTVRPYSNEVKTLKNQMEQEYNVPVVALNCMQIKKEDIYAVLEKILFEFPITNIQYFIPKWTEMLGKEHYMKQALVSYAGYMMNEINSMRDVKSKVWKNGEYIERVFVRKMDLSDGSVDVQIDVEPKYYYENMSELTGEDIQSEYQLIQMIRNLASMKREYEKVKDAMNAVEQKGYGVVMPELSDISMDDPELIQHGGKYGVKMKALSPSIHMIKANIETEIAPIVGSKEQAEDLITYIKQGGETKEGIWTTNIFGKSVGELTEDGIRSKISQMDDECQMKLQDTMQKIVNDMNGGMVCIII